MPNPLRIAFEDARLLILEKPVGISSAPIPSSVRGDQTMVDRALELQPKLPLPEGFEHERGLMHRLDRDTSGLLVFAKDDATYFALRSDWKTSRVEKRYRALTSQSPGEFAWPHSIQIPLGASPKSSKKMQPVRTALDRRLMTPLKAHTELLSAPQRFLGRKALHDIEIALHTGVRHQIRCHLATLGAPILGDRVYGGEPFERLCLHASYWAWTPARGPRVEVRSEPGFPWTKLTG